MVVNTSLGWDVAPPDAEAQAGRLRLGAARARDRGPRGPPAARDLGRQRRGAVVANSRWSAAALRTDLTDAAGQPMPALRNTLSVENLVETPSPEFEPGCLGDVSNRGGTIAAVGTDVHSHLFGSAGR